MAMKRAFILVLMAACGGPTQQQVVEAPSATAPFPHYEAPPASASDLDRERLVQQFDDMTCTQEAYGQAKRESPVSQQPASTAPPKKRGPAEQATLPPSKTSGR